jgi:hypothetical protein
MACDSHLVVLAIQAWGSGRGADVDIQRLLRYLEAELHSLALSTAKSW